MARLKYAFGGIIAIGASAGGTQAIAEVLKKLPEAMPPILIVQHMPEGFTRMYAERLNQIVAMTVVEAQDGDCVSPNTAYIAPGGKQMTIFKKDNQLFISCAATGRVSGHSPSVDVLFDSVAKIMGSNAIGVILTGMGNDGSKGLLDMRRKKARTIGQDKESSMVYGMPAKAFEAGGVETQVPLDKIPETILGLIQYGKYD